MKRKFTALLLAGCIVMQYALPVAAESDVILADTEAYSYEETEEAFVSESEDSNFVTDIEVPPVEEQAGDTEQNILPEEEPVSESDSEEEATSAPAEPETNAEFEANGMPEANTEPETNTESEITIEPETSTEPTAIEKPEETEESTPIEEVSDSVQSEGNTETAQSEEDSNLSLETLPPAKEILSDEPEIDTILAEDSVSSIIETTANDNETLFYTIDNSDGSVSITGYLVDPGKESGILNIPSKINGKPVSAIGSCAFTGRTGFTGLSLPDSLVSIEDHAFWNCSGFTGTLTLPASLVSIGDSAFSRCSGFTGLSLPASLSSIGADAFSDCSGFTGTLTLPASLASIGAGAFSRCSGFTGTLVLPASLASIGDYAFSDCSGFTGTLSLPASLTSIGDYAFWGCSGFTGKLTIPANAKVANNAFFQRIYINKRWDGYNVELWIGEEETLNAYSDGSSSRWLLDSASPSTVTWSSSNDSVAKVDKGVVTAVSAGEATITARAYNGETCTAKIRVLSKQSSGRDKQAPVVNSVTFQQSIRKSGVLTLSANITEEGSGLISMGVYFTHAKDSSQSISASANWDFSPKYSGTCQIEVPIPSKIKSGEYLLKSISYEDAAGNMGSYTYSTGLLDVFGQPLSSFRTNDSYDVKINVNNGNNSLLVKDEFDVSFQTSITSQLSSMPEGTTAMIKFDSSNHTAKKEWFEAIKGKDKTILLSNGSIQWRFNGKDITAPKDIDCLVTLHSNKFTEYGGEEPSLEVVFAPNGTLPGPATVRLKSDYLGSIYRLYRQLFFYYIKNDKSLQQEGTATYFLDGTDHWCELPLTHNSSFIISGQKLSTTIRKVVSIKLDKSSASLQKGKSVTLKATVSPSSAANKKLKWTTSNKKVATVDSKGKVTGKGFGTATITATSTDGSKKTAKCKVTVGYGITYKLNGGKNNSQNPSAYYKQGVTLKNPTRKNYIFSGWYTDKKYQKKITKITTKNTDNLTLYAKWKTAVPGKPAISSLKNSKKKTAILKFKKASGAAGYEVVYGTDKKFKKGSSKITTKKTSVTLKNLKKSKTYYVKIRAYQKDSTGKTVYGSYSKVSSVKIKK